MDGPPTAGGFWATVTWPRGEGLAIVVGLPLALFAVAAARHDPTGDGTAFGALVTAGAVPVLAALWALHRVLGAWVEWPSRSRAGRWAKAVVRFVSVGPRPGAR